MTSSAPPSCARNFGISRTRPRWIDSTSFADIFLPSMMRLTTRRSIIADLVAVDDLPVLIVGLGCGQRAVGGVHLEDLVEHARPVSRRTETPARANTSSERSKFSTTASAAHRSTQHFAARQPSSDLRSRAADRRGHRSAHRHVEQDAVLHRTRQRADRVIAARQRNKAGRVDAPVCWSCSRRRR